MDEKQHLTEVLTEMTKVMRGLQDQLLILENRINDLEVHTGLYPHGHCSDEPDPGDLTEYYHGDIEDAK